MDFIVVVMSLLRCLSKYIMFIPMDMADSQLNRVLLITHSQSLCRYSSMLRADD